MAAERRPIVFVAYAREDKARVHEIVSDLRNDLDVKWDGDPISDKWRDFLKAQIESADHLVWIMSAHSAVSKHVREEWDIAGRAGSNRMVLTIDDFPTEEIAADVAEFQCYPEERIVQLVQAITERDLKTARRSLWFYKPEMMKPLILQCEDSIRSWRSMDWAAWGFGLAAGLAGLITQTDWERIVVVAGAISLCGTSVFPKAKIQDLRAELARLNVAREAYEEHCGQDAHGKECASARRLIQLAVDNRLGGASD